MASDVREVLITAAISLVLVILMFGGIIAYNLHYFKSDFYDHAAQVSPGFYCLTTNDGHISGNCEIDYAALDKFGEKHPVVLKTFDDKGILYTQIQYTASRDSGPLDIPNRTRTAVVRVTDLGNALVSKNPRRALYDLNDDIVKPDNFAPVKGFDKKTLKPIIQ